MQEKCAIKIAGDGGWLMTKVLRVNQLPRVLFLRQVEGANLDRSMRGREGLMQLKTPTLHQMGRKRDATARRTQQVATSQLHPVVVHACGRMPGCAWVVPKITLPKISLFPHFFFAPRK